MQSGLSKIIKEKDGKIAHALKRERRGKEAIYTQYSKRRTAYIELISHEKYS